MNVELKMLVCTLILAVVQILLASTLRSQETGLDWCAGPRDNPSSAKMRKVTGRMMRAQANLFETLPIFAAAVLVAQAANVHTSLTHWAVVLYFWARVFYIPFYALGTKYVRTIVWLVSLAGVVMMLIALLRAMHVSI